MGDETKAGPDKEQTEVTKWLRAHQASQFADGFYDQGYYALADVDDAAIKALVEPRGTANRLMRSRRSAVSGEPMAPPAVPSGRTPDLSTPELPPVDTGDFGMAIEKGGIEMPAKIEAPTELPPEKWEAIARNSGLLYAWRMNGEKPERGRRVLDWVGGEPEDYVLPHLEAEIDIAVSYTSETKAYVESGFDTQSASLGYAFCAASFKRERNERRAHISETKVLHGTGVWRYPIATVFLDECTKPSAHFVKAVRRALDEDHPDRALQDVFDEYGHSIPRVALLGGQLWLTKERRETGSVNEDEFTNEIGAAIGVSLGGFQPGVKWKRGSGEKETESARSGAERQHFQGRGGDPRLTHVPADWAATLNDPMLWAVIVNKNAKPTVDRLSDELRTRVLAHWRPAAIADPEAHEARESVIDQAESTGFFIGTRECEFPQRGSVELVSGRSTRKATVDGEASAGVRAFAHFYKADDIHYRVMSAFIPVRAGDHYGSFFDDTFEHPRRRLEFIKCDLTLGPWRSWPSEGESVASEDGFLLVSIDASRPGWRGGVAASVNGKRLAGAAVHWYDPKDNHINAQGFCIPVPAQSSVVLESRPSVGSPVITAAWMPMLDERWRMLAAQLKELGAVEHADTDGILTGWIDASHTTRGCLKMYVGRGGEANDDWSRPAAAASAHYYKPKDRRVNWSSATLAVGRDAWFKTSLTDTHHKPKVHLHWTPIVPS